MALPVSPRRRRASRIPMAPMTSRSWECQAPMRLTIRCVIVATLKASTPSAIDQYLFRLFVQPRTDRDKQGNIDSRQVRAAYHGLRHVFGHCDPAREEYRHFIADPFIDKLEMDGADHITRKKGFFSAGRAYLRTTVVGDNVNDLRADLCKA